MQKASITLLVCLYALAAMAQRANSDLVDRGIDLRNQDKPTAALKCFQQAMAKAPGDLRAHAEYVQTKAYDLDRFDEVRAEYEALMVKHSRDAVYPMALATGQSLTPGDGKRAWYEAVARISPDSAWGMLAKAKLVLVKTPDVAVAFVDRAVELDPSLADGWWLRIFLREHRLNDVAGALSVAEQWARRPEPEFRASGLYEKWRLRLLIAKDSAEAVSAMRQELQTLAANESDLSTLITVRRAWTTLLHDTNGAQAVESMIRKLDPAWYPERGERIYFANGNESGVPIQGIAVNRQVKVVSAVFDMNEATTPEQKIDALRNLLPDCTSPSVRRLVYQRLYRTASEANDVDRIIEFGEKYKEESSRVLPELADAALLAQIALARAARSADLPRAAAYAREAFRTTATFQPWPRPWNTDQTWFSHFSGQEDRYKSTRALALEAQGWVLCQMGQCEVGEPLLRQAVELRRSERNLTHLANALEKVGRVAEAADTRTQAASEWLESLKRRMTKVPSKEFEATTVDGRSMRLSSLQGKVVLVNFWATWCTPCIQEMPVLEELYQKYRDRGLEILAVSVDEEAARYKVEQFVHDQRLHFPVLYDSGAGSLYGVAVYPTSLLIDQNGLVRLRFNLLQRRSFEAILEQVVTGRM